MELDRAKLTRNILIGMVLGLVLGSIVHSMALSPEGAIMVYGINGLFDIGGKIFIASLKLLVVPLVFVSLACGASNLAFQTWRPVIIMVREATQTAPPHAPEL